MHEYLQRDKGEETIQGYRRKFRKFNFQNSEDAEIKKEENNEGEVQEIRKKNKTFKPKDKNELETVKMEETNIFEKPIKRIYIRKNFEKDEFSNGSKRGSEIGSKNSQKEIIQIKDSGDDNQKRDSKIESDFSNKDGYNIKIYQKKKLSRSKIDDINQQDLDSKNKGLYLFENNKNEKEEDKYNEFKDKNNAFSQKDNLISKLSEAFQRDGLPTKIKIYKCVVWKNSDPKVNEDTIKNFIHRSGSELLNKGGFVMKLPQNKSFKGKQGFI